MLRSTDHPLFTSLKIQLQTPLAAAATLRSSAASRPRHCNCRRRRRIWGSESESCSSAAEGRRPRPRPRRRRSPSRRRPSRAPSAAAALAPDLAANRSRRRVCCCSEEMTCSSNNKQSIGWDLKRKEQRGKERRKEGRESSPEPLLTVGRVNLEMDSSSGGRGVVPRRGDGGPNRPGSSQIVNHTMCPNCWSYFHLIFFRKSRLHTRMFYKGHLILATSSL